MKGMRAAVLTEIKKPLQLKELPNPSPGLGQVLLRVSVCGVCRTDLHVVDGDLPSPKIPLVPGHQIVGVVEETGKGVVRFSPGDRIGISWLGESCGYCRYCLSGQENLCDTARYTGYQIDGGFAEKCLASEKFCFSIPAGYSDLSAAPLLCAGLIGYRALRFAGEAEKIGFYGFGAAAHILIQIAQYQGRKAYAFTRPGDKTAQSFALQLGALWAGDSDQPPPEPLDAAIIFAPVGSLLPVALKAVRKAGIVICAGIHMSDIPSFPYQILWGERVIRSVANLTRQDGEEFFALTSQIPIQTQVNPYPLERVNQALEDLRQGRFSGAAVIVVNSDGVR